MLLLIPPLVQQAHHLCHALELATEGCVLFLFGNPKWSRDEKLCDPQVSQRTAKCLCIYSSSLLASRTKRTQEVNLQARVD
jgi:hypothetical protein